MVCGAGVYHITWWVLTGLLRCCGQVRSISRCPDFDWVSDYKSRTKSTDSLVWHQKHQIKKPHAFRKIVPNKKHFLEHPPCLQLLLQLSDFHFRPNFHGAHVSTHEFHANLHRHGEKPQPAISLSHWRNHGAVNGGHLAGFSSPRNFWFPIFVLLVGSQSRPVGSPAMFVDYNILLFIYIYCIYIYTIYIYIFVKYPHFCWFKATVLWLKSPCSIVVKLLRVVAQTFKFAAPIPSVLHQIPEFTPDPQIPTIHPKRPTCFFEKNLLKPYQDQIHHG